jgi:wyosine [tRNA(Phe)-imidazoG37] synthetase (radical SAM superfamily)
MYFAALSAVGCPQPTEKSHLSAVRCPHLAAANHMKYLFGPVPSRRLGISLGVDVLPPKTCTFDCVYCEIGRTTQRTRRRADYTPKGEILREIHDYLSSDPDPQPDVITFSGSGEPTLHTRLGEMISEVKEMTSVPVAVITNSSLLYLPEVRDDVMEADIILPSLDAVSEKVFRKLNRPEPSMKVDLIISGLHLLRQEYKGQIWLEILVVAGINDSKDELEKLAKTACELRPDKVQVHTASRPSPVNEVEPASLETLRSLARAIGDHAEVMPDIPTPKHRVRIHLDAMTEIYNIISKRPGRVKDIIAITGMKESEVAARLNEMVESGRVKKHVHEGSEYYIRA